MFKFINYNQLNSRQKESYNFQKVSGLLADYGYKTILLSDDWNGADFLAVHIDGVSVLKIQLKSRLTFNKKYQGKNLHICFRHNDDWYLYPHDECLHEISSDTFMLKSISWVEKGSYSSGRLSENQKRALEKYLIKVA